MSGIRIVGVGHTAETVAVDGFAQVRVYPRETIVMLDGGLRRLSVVDGNVHDEPITDPREYNRISALFDEDDD